MALSRDQVHELLQATESQLGPALSRLSDAELRQLGSLPEDEIERRIAALDPPVRAEIAEAARERIARLKEEQKRMLAEMRETERSLASVGELPVQDGLHVIEGARRHGDV